VKGTSVANTEGAYIILNVTSFENSKTDGTVSFRLIGLENALGGDFATKEHANAVVLKVSFCSNFGSIVCALVLPTKNLGL
jgi:hypothetical protein